MTEAQRAQQIVDRVMREMAIRHGSSTRRDFEVASLVLDKVVERASPSGLAAKLLQWAQEIEDCAEGAHAGINATIAEMRVEADALLKAAEQEG